MGLTSLYFCYFCVIWLLKTVYHLLYLSLLFFLFFFFPLFLLPFSFCTTLLLSNCENVILLLHVTHTHHQNTNTHTSIQIRSLHIITGCFLYWIYPMQSFCPYFSFKLFFGLVAISFFSPTVQDYITFFAYSLDINFY